MVRPASFWLWFLLGSLFFTGGEDGYAQKPTSNLVIRVEDMGEAVRIVAAPADSITARLFVLGEPNRIVIDLPGVPPPHLKEFIPKANPLIHRLRFGVHPDKIRIVADVKTPNIPPPLLSEAEGGIAISVPVSAEARAAFISASAQTTELGTTRESAAVAVGEAVFPARTGQNLETILFERGAEDGAPVVRIGLTERPTFSFQKADAKTYRLSLANCKVAGAHLALHHYPPDDFVGFSIVEIRQVGDDTEILVGVDHNFKIVPTTTERAILIRSLPRG
jgi:hypothetical protein